MKTDISKELSGRHFSNRELGLSHPTYDTELAFYELVKNGDTEALEEMKRSGKMSDVNIPERGTLSEDKIRNLKYHIIVTAAMVCRFCIEGGMNEQDSYGLSDIYISRVDKASTERQLLDLHSEMVFDYAKRMKRLGTGKYMNIYCIKAMEYISDNLHRAVSVKEIAEHLKIDRSYFSKLFKKETGMTVSMYIRRKKISAAQDMLIYTDLPCSAVSEILGFASQSYFTENFKRLCGMTPGEYRIKNYRRHWDNGDSLDD